MNNYNTAAASEDGATHHSTAPSKPVAVAGDLENLPGCFGPLLALPVWVLWRWEEKRDKDGNTKWTKPPIQTNGRLAKNNDPSTWTTHAKAIAALNQGRGDGIGLMLAGCSGMIALDLDDCRNAETGELQPWAQELVDAAASYTEVTPSGEGLRIIGVGNIGSVQRRFNGLPDGGAAGTRAAADPVAYRLNLRLLAGFCWRGFTISSFLRRTLRPSPDRSPPRGGAPRWTICSLNS